MPQWAKNVLLMVLIAPPVATYCAILVGLFAFVWASPFIFIWRLFK